MCWYIPSNGVEQMIIDKNITRITLENVDIHKIISGGGILWEKEKVYRLEWSKVGTTTSDNKTYNDHLFKSYELVKGKIIPGEKATYGLWGDLFFYINNDVINKFEWASSYIKKIDGGSIQVMVFNIYDGKIIEEYR